MYDDYSSKNYKSSLIKDFDSFLRFNLKRIYKSVNLDF